MLDLHLSPQIFGGGACSIRALTLHRMCFFRANNLHQKILNLFLSEIRASAVCKKFFPSKHFSIHFCVIYLMRSILGYNTFRTLRSVLVATTATETFSPLTSRCYIICEPISSLFVDHLVPSRVFCGGFIVVCLLLVGMIKINLAGNQQFPHKEATEPFPLQRKKNRRSLWREPVRSTAHISWLLPRCRTRCSAAPCKRSPGGRSAGSSHRRSS